MGKLFNRKYLEPERKSLRNHQTKAEKMLWMRLKKKQLAGRKFRRQHSIENCILDFYCPSEKLAIELDGGYHRNPVKAENDRIRDERLNNLGITVLRFKNEEVFNNLEGVLQKIKQAFSG